MARLIESSTGSERICMVGSYGDKRGSDGYNYNLAQGVCIVEQYGAIMTEKQNCCYFVVVMAAVQNSVYERIASGTLSGVDTISEIGSLTLDTYFCFCTLDL